LFDYCLLLFILKIIFIGIQSKYVIDGSGYMIKLQTLENDLKELKLQKRELILAAKDTSVIDNRIKEIENKIRKQD
jgi:hypothetical protein